MDKPIIDRPQEQIRVPAQSGPTRPPRILVVDDHPFIRQFSTDILSRSGYTVDAANDGAAAWLVLNTNNYDLLITDHFMPRMTGVELVELVRASRMPLPVIMVTAQFPKEEFTRYPWLKPSATLLKPFTTSELLKTVKEVLSTTEGLVERDPRSTQMG